MKIVKAAANLVLTGALSACAGLSETPLMPQPSYAPVKTSEIYLQEPFTRVVARCYSTADVTTADYAADACAKYFEKQGYVRFSNIPYKTARYDFLRKDTYPTRLWREHEVTPRW